jgi:hypothetical protein
VAGEQDVHAFLDGEDGVGALLDVELGVAETAVRAMTSKAMGPSVSLEKTWVSQGVTWARGRRCIRPMA